MTVRWLERRYRDIMRERKQHEKPWGEIGRYFFPMRPRLFTPKSKKERGNSQILDNSPIMALRTLTSGLLAGMASPARPWFDLKGEGSFEATDEEKVWLRVFRDAILATFDRSNFYQELGSLFESAGAFGTGAMLVLPDQKSGIRCQALPIGSYAIAQDHSGRVDSFVRDVPMTVRQVVAEFGEENLSKKTERLAKEGRWEDMVHVRHCVWPKPRGEKSAWSYLEYYFEAPGNAGDGSETPTWNGSVEDVGLDDSSYLRSSGYYEFPLIVCRWERNSEDVYGTNSPGLSSISDVKQLQSMVRRFTNAAEKTLNPALIVDPQLEGAPISLQSGAVTFGTEGAEGARPLHEVRYDFASTQQMIVETRSRIREAFYTDIFLMLLGDSRATPPTAEEVRAREREKMIMLGPVLERFSDEVFTPLIERVSGMLFRRSEPNWAFGLPALIPEPPESILSGESPVRVEYTSEVAAAQKMSNVGFVERWLQQIGGLSELDPRALQIPDFDAVARAMAESLGVDPRLVRTPQSVTAEREAEAQAAQSAGRMDSIQKAAGAAKDVAASMPGGDTTAIDGVVEAAFGGNG